MIFRKQKRETARGAMPTPNPVELAMGKNTIITGSNGSGKTWNFIIPSILRETGSLVVTDPGGFVMGQVGKYLEDKGYRIKCLNLMEFDKSNHYNPFRYIRNDKDVKALVDALILNTRYDQTDINPLLEACEKPLLSALISYLNNYVVAKEQTFTNVIKLLTAEGDILDRIFDEVEKYEPDGSVVRHYRAFKKLGVDSQNGIIKTCITRLMGLARNDIASLTDTDDIDLERVFSEKTALFICLPTGEAPFNCLAAILYTQILRLATCYAEHKAPGSVVVADGDGTPVKVFWDTYDKKAGEESKAFLERSKDGAVRFNETCGWYEAFTQDGDVLAHRGGRKEAEKALALIAKGTTCSQPRRGLPLSLALYMEEYPNTGRIPDLARYMSYGCVWGFPVKIVFQSFEQFKKMQPYSWDVIESLCDVVVAYAGAGIFHYNWIKSRLDGCPVRAENEDNYKHVFTLAELRQLGVHEAIIIVGKTYSYRYKWQKYDPLRTMALKAGKYEWKKEKSASPDMCWPAADAGKEGQVACEEIEEKNRKEG